MKATIDTLQQIVADFTPALFMIDQEVFVYKPLPEKWSKKEIMGHLVDSALNNARRFVIGQYEEAPKIVYNQDRWVAIAGYQGYPLKELINLWASLNNHICIILTNTTPEAATRTCRTNDPLPLSIEWLAADYVKHLRHHLHQVLDLEEIAYP